jgi:hypothetical protein
MDLFGGKKNNSLSDLFLLLRSSFEVGDGKMAKHVTFLLTGVIISVIVFANFGFTVFSVKEYGFTREDATRALYQKSSVTIDGNALDGKVKIPVGQNAAGAARVTVGTVHKDVFNSAISSAVGSGVREGTATYKSNTKTELVGYKLVTVDGNTATVHVELDEVKYQFGVTCDSTGDCPIFALVENTVTNTRKLHERARIGINKVDFDSKPELEFERALGGKGFKECYASDNDVRTVRNACSCEGSCKLLFTADEAAAAQADPSTWHCVC